MTLIIIIIYKMTAKNLEDRQEKILTNFYLLIMVKLPTHITSFCPQRTRMNKKWAWRFMLHLTFLKHQAPVLKWKYRLILKSVPPSKKKMSKSNSIEWEHLNSRIVQHPRRHQILSTVTTTSPLEEVGCDGVNSTVLGIIVWRLRESYWSQSGLRKEKNFLHNCGKN